MPATVKLLSGEYIPWREQLDMADAYADEWDEFLGEADDAASNAVAGESQRNRVTRVNVAPRPNLQRYDASRHNKTASTQSWDDDMELMQGHVTSVLAKLGNR